MNIHYGKFIQWTNVYVNVFCVHVVCKNNLSCNCPCQMLHMSASCFVLISQVYSLTENSSAHIADMYYTLIPTLNAYSRLAI